MQLEASFLVRPTVTYKPVLNIRQDHTHTHILVTLTSTHQKTPDHLAVQQGGKLEHESVNKILKCGQI